MHTHTQFNSNSARNELGFSCIKQCLGSLTVLINSFNTDFNVIDQDGLRISFNWNFKAEKKTIYIFL